MQMLSVDISNRSEFFVTGAAFHPATSFVAERLMQEQLYEVVMVMVMVMVKMSLVVLLLVSVKMIRHT